MRNSGLGNFGCSCWGRGVLNRDVCGRGRRWGVFFGGFGLGQPSVPGLHVLGCLEQTRLKGELPALFGVLLLSGCGAGLRKLWEAK